MTSFRRISLDAACCFYLVLIWFAGITTVAQPPFLDPFRRVNKSESGCLDCNDNRNKIEMKCHI